MADDLVTVRIARNLAEADVIRGVLEAHGVPTLIRDESATMMLDGMISGNKGVAIAVPRGEAERAEQVLEEARRAGDEEE
jgi:hypothetical protein